jgi:hypothetical protein
MKKHLILVKLISSASLVFVLVTGCQGQQSSESQQTMSSGERLLKVEETLNELRSHPQPSNIEILRKLETELKSILDSDSQTIFGSQLEADLDVVNEGLAYHDLLVAQFYMSKAGGHGLRGAEARLARIVQSYPKFSKMDEVLFRLAFAKLAVERTDEGASLLWKLICRYPDSQYVKAAFARLYEIGINSWQGCDQFKQ